MASDVPNCTEFSKREGAIGAVAAGIANVTHADAKSVLVTLTCSRRLTSDDLSVRRLEAVNGAYEITIPAGSPSGFAEMSVSYEIYMQGTNGLEKKVAAAMTAAGITDIVVKVNATPKPTHETTFIDAPATTPKATMVPTGAPGSVTVFTVKGTMALTPYKNGQSTEATNCTEFLKREGAIGAMAAGIASATGPGTGMSGPPIRGRVDAKSVLVNLTCFPPPNIMAMNGAYEITIPAGSPLKRGVASGFCD